MTILGKPKQIADQITTIVGAILEEDIARKDFFSTPGKYLPFSAGTAANLRVLSAFSWAARNTRAMICTEIG